MRKRKRAAWLFVAPTAGVLLAGLLAALWAVNLPTEESRRASQPLGSIAPGAQPKPESVVRPLSGPWVVAVQPGHWQINLLPGELERLRTDSGAQWGNLYEVDINRAVVAALMPLIESKGWKAVLVPATVPPGLRADAFVAVHADSSSDTSRRGWKLAPPWRSSGASRKLAAAMSASFASDSNLLEDSGGVTVNMRGYYAFNYRRFDHSISPYTPALIIEMGFLSNPLDRQMLTSDPAHFAKLILHGLESYFQGRSRTETADLQPMELPWVAAGADGALARVAPSPGALPLWRIDPGTVMMPVDASGSWYEVFVRRHYATGWVPKSELVEAADPHWPMPGELRGAADRR